MLKLVIFLSCFFAVSFAEGCGKTTCIPLHIKLAGTGKPTEMVVGWATVTNPKESYVMYGEHKDNLNLKAPTSIDRSYLKRGFFSVEQDLELNHQYTPRVYWYHFSFLRNLKPSTTYYYQIGSEGGKSKVLSFMTPPPTVTATQTAANFSFVVYGDQGVKNSQEVIKRVQNIVRYKSADLVFHIGDISYADDYEGNLYEDIWNQWATNLEPITSSLPYMVTPGNHEYSCEHKGCDYSLNFTAYNHRFRMPGVESGTNLPNSSMWYSFDYSGVHFVAISTETDFPDAPEGKAKFGNQFAWLEQDLLKANANRKNVPWIIVGGHRPIYASSKGYSTAHGIPEREAANLQKYLEPILYKHKVDIFVVGHVHSQERTYPMYNNKVVSKDYNNPKAPTYLVVGCAGNEEGLNGDDQWMPKPEWSASRYNKDWGYMIMKVVQTQSIDSLQVNFFSAKQNKIEDTFKITKSR